MIRRLCCRPTCRVFAGWSLPFSPLPLLSMTPDKCHKVESFFSLCLIPSHCAQDKREASSKDCPCRRSIGPLRRRCSCFASNSEDRIHHSWFSNGDNCLSNERPVLCSRCSAAELAPRHQRGRAHRHDRGRRRRLPGGRAHAPQVRGRRRKVNNIPEYAKIFL